MKRKSSEIQFTSLVLCASFIIAQIDSQLKVQATSELVLPVDRTTGLSCVPENRTVSYECTISDTTGGLTTIWEGSAFKCSENQILLLHGSDLKSGECDTLIATSVRVNGSEYTSQLNLTATADFNGATIICTRSGNNPVKFNDTIRIGVRPSPPGPLSVTLSVNLSFIVSWTPPLIQNNINGYQFLVTGEGCGCDSMTVSANSTRVSCSNWTASGQTCSFEVWTISLDCGFISDTTNEVILLMVPPTPTQLLVTIGIDQVKVEFMQPTLPILGANLTSTITYTLRVVAIGFNFSNSSNKVTCDDTNKCNLTFPNSKFSTRDSYNVSVVASNIFGSGPPAFYFECNPEDLGSNQTSLRGQGIVNVSHGLIHYSGVSPDSIATLQCNDGYRALSFLNRTCMFGGRWSDEALECVIMEEETGITPACPLYCAVLVGFFVFGIMLVLIIVCIAITLYILKKYGRECYTLINTSKKVQLHAVNRESPTTNESSLSPVDMQPLKAKINVHRSEPSKSAQVDPYANPEDFVKTPPHMQPRKNEGAGEVPKPLTVEITKYDEVSCAQYESIEVARPVKVTATQPSQEVYSEVFDALPKGKSTLIVKKATLTK